jgi:hypothetical protein
MEALEIIQRIESELTELKNACGTPRPTEKSLAEKLQESVKDWKGGDNAPLFWKTLASIAEEHYGGKK